MSRRLLDLRGVPAEEADGLREALDSAGLEYYELPATAFGISAGSIWIRHDRDFEQARAVFDAFQQSLLAQARKERSDESFLSHLRRNPRRVIGYAAAAGFVLMVLFWPVLQLWR